MRQRHGRLIAWFCAVVFGLGALAVLPTQSQIVSGDLVGTVYDKSGAVVPNATVEAVNVATNVKHTTQVTGQGEYRFTNLSVGRYHVSASAPNFATTTVQNFSIELNKTATLPITLELRSTVSTVEVIGAGESLDTTTAQITSDYTAEQIANMPLAANGSGVINLSLLGAGVASSGGVGVGTGPSVGGQRPRNNNFTVEGVDNNDTSVTGPLVTVPNDAVSEFSVLQNQFSADFGHSSGGQFNTVVKSGTNEFHGMAYLYNQNRNYNALDTIQKLSDINTVPRYDNNRIGGNVGGPILKNKLFFFVNYEYMPVGQAGVPGNVCAPSSAGLAVINSYPGLSQTNVAQFEKYVPVGTVSGSGCKALSFPNPTGPGTIPVETLGLSFLAPNWNNTKNLVTSGDWNIGSKDQLRARYIYENYEAIDNAAELPVFFTQTPSKYDLVAINEYHTFNPALANEFRVGYNRYATSLPAGNFSYPGLDSFPNLQFNDLNYLQVGPDGNAPQSGTQNTYQVADTVTWTKNTHTFTFGVEGRKLIAPSTFTQRVRGDYEYTNVLAFFEDQVPNSLAERSGGNAVYEGNRSAFYGFVNDNWRLRPNLTVNIGVRYERTTIPYTETLQSLNAIASVPGLVTFASPETPNNNWAPRVGFAYSPGTSGKTSIRAGFSMAYDVLFDNLGLLTLPPELSTTIDCAPVGQYTCPNPFLAGGGIPPGKGGVTTYPDQATAASNTSAYIPVHTTYPEAITWNLSVQHSFGNDYTVEVRYLGTRGLFLPVQARLNAAPQVTSSVFLPTYTTAPSQAMLNALPYDLNGISNGAYGNGDGLVPAWEKGGFTGSYVTSYQPWGASTYHGLATQVNKRMSHGLQLIGSYTFSHNIDNSTAEVFSTVLAPRRAQSFQDLAAERANSILDHRHRFTIGEVYNLPYFKQGSWVERNLLGNWEIDGLYTFQSGQWVTGQSGIDSNLNGDAWPDRTIFNPLGVPGTGSGVIPLCNNTVASCPTTLDGAGGSPAGVVAYLAQNPTAQYIQAGYGAKANVGRNTMQLPPINNIDLAVGKTISFTERFKVSVSAQAINIFNHPQWIGGYLNDVAPIGYTGSERTMLEPGSSTFNMPSQVFSSNPRYLQLVLKIAF